MLRKVLYLNSLVETHLIIVSQQQMSSVCITVNCGRSVLGLAGAGERGTVFQQNGNSAPSIYQSTPPPHHTTPRNMQTGQSHLPPHTPNHMHPSIYQPHMPQLQYAQPSIYQPHLMHPSVYQHLMPHPQPQHQPQPRYQTQPQPQLPVFHQGAMPPGPPPPIPLSDHFFEPTSVRREIIDREKERARQQEEDEERTQQLLHPNANALPPPASILLRPPPASHFSSIPGRIHFQSISATTLALDHDETPAPAPTPAETVAVTPTIARSPAPARTAAQTIAPPEPLTPPTSPTIALHAPIFIPIPAPACTLAEAVVATPAPAPPVSSLAKAVVATPTPAPIIAPAIAVPTLPPIAAKARIVGGERMVKKTRNNYTIGDKQEMLMLIEEAEKSGKKLSRVEVRNLIQEKMGVNKKTRVYQTFAPIGIKLCPWILLIYVY